MDPNNPVQDPANPGAAANPPLNPDLAGYPDVQSLVNAYRQSGAEAKKWRDEAETKQHQLEQFQVGYAANPRPNVPDRSNGTPGWQQRLETLGIPTDDIREAIRSEARGMIQEELQPVMQVGAARTQVVAKYPDYAKFEADIGAHLNNSAEVQETYNRVFKADPVAAFEWLYADFGRSRRAQVQQNGQDRQGAEHAAIPSQRAGDSRGGGYGNESDVAVQEAAQAYRDNPSRANAEKYARARLRAPGVITDEHLYNTQ